MSVFDGFAQGMVRYIEHALAVGEHTSPMTGTRTIFTPEQITRLQELSDGLVDDIASGAIPTSPDS